jgi:hypothetical protein
MLTFPENELFLLHIVRCQWLMLCSLFLCGVLCRVGVLYLQYYEPEGGGFDSRWGNRIFQLTYSFQPHYGAGFDSASSRNEYQEISCGVKGGRCVKADNLTAICEPIV